MRELIDTGISQSQLRQLTLLLAAAALPHLLNLSLLVMAFFLVLIGYRLYLLQRSWQPPGRAIKIGLTLAAAAVVWLLYRTLIGQEGGVALLTILLGLKTLELHSRRDLYVTLFLTFFLIVTQYLFNQTILLTIYSLLVIWGLVSLLVAVHRVGEDPELRESSRLARRMLLQALPMMVILFVVFPRLSGPLWSMPLKKSAMTGLSDTLQPGVFSDLIQSEAIVMRVNFLGNIPAPQQRYWRGPVMYLNDGRRWRAGAAQMQPIPRYRKASNPVTYDVILEGNSSVWLPVLDMPTGDVSRAVFTEDYNLITRGDNQLRRNYRMTSFLDYRTSDITSLQLRQSTQLPHNVTPRMRELVKGWQAQTDNPGELIQLALAFFNQQKFYYTLQPPLLGNNPVDEFLFESRRGFCEHYAASFATLMRLAGIPTRVVAGYLGGEFNEMGKYLIVRQSDAHAWTEVYLEGAGWQRVDPTLAVAPRRVLESLDLRSLSDEEASFGRANQNAWAELRHNWTLISDAIDVRWQLWILSYSNNSQDSLLEGLGLGWIKRSGLWLLSLLLPLLMLALVAWGLAVRGKRPKEPTLLLYQRFCERAARAGLPRLANEGPLDFAARLSQQWPEQASQIQAVSRHYVALRYGKSLPDKASLRELHNRIQAFRPRRIATAPFEPQPDT